MAVVSQWLAVGFGVWLIGLGVFMLVSPDRALEALASMGGSTLVHYGEMALRIAAGAALVLAAGQSRFPQIIAVTGGFLVVSAVVITILPRRWHAAYSTWWAHRIPAAAVRVFALVSGTTGAVLIWSIL